MTRSRHESTTHPRPSVTTLALAAALALLALTAVACGGGGDDGSPTAPGTSPLTMTAASVHVDGQRVDDGATYRHPHGGSAGSTLFRAVLERDGVPVTGQDVICRFDLPQEGHRHQHRGEFHLYDDGTHGDPQAGDGVYHHEDHAGRYGFHHQGAHHGEYHYEMWGQGPQGGESNHRMIDVTVVD